VISALGTYLPTWSEKSGGRICGPDEDAVTLAVAAGRAALGALGTDAAPIAGVSLVSRDLPLLEGGNAAALLGGLGLDPGTDVVERLGGAPATLDAVAAAPPSWLVIGADAAAPAGAAGAVTGARGGNLSAVGRVHRSLPLRARGQDGIVHEDDDPRLQRERGTRASFEAAGLLGKPDVIAGLRRKEAVPFCHRAPIELPTLGASAPLFALAALAESGASGLVAATEQATVSAVSWDPADTKLRRDESQARELPRRRPGSGPEIKLVFTAYDRAFEPKLRWEAGQCRSCATLAFPPRHRCLACGAERAADLVPLPRTGVVYTATTIRVPVPGLETPYTLAVVELDGVGVRALVTATDFTPGSLEIGTRGRLIFRRVALRSGVPDYGYAFSPEVAS